MNQSARAAGPARGAAVSIFARPIARRALVVVSLIGLILLFFNRMAFSNLILARGDTFLYFYPYWTAAAEALRAGRVPFWNPDLFMGAPFLANSQAGFFYPLNWPVWLLLPAPYAVSASILLHLLIAALGAYLAGRRTLALGRTAALFAAALFAMGGYLTAQVEHVNQLQGLAWLPWFFVALSPIVDRQVGNPWRDWLRAILFVGALFALQLLAGHTQTAFITGVAVTIWLGVCLVLNLSGSGKLDWFRVALVWGAGVALAVILSAVQLLPTLELAGQSSRQGGLSFNEVLSFSWHPVHLTRALLPAYSRPLFSEYVAFLPLTALALAVVGAWAWRREKVVAAWVFLVALGFVLALGRFTPLYYLLGRLPGFDLFRAPSRWLVVVALGLALLAGYGWQRLRDYVDAGQPAGSARDALVRPLLFAAVGLALLVVWGYIAAWPAARLPVGAEAPFERPAALSLLGWLIEAALAILLLWIVFTAPRERASGALRDIIVLALAALWLGSRGLPYNQLTTPEAYFDLRPPQARLIALTTCAVPGRDCVAPPARFLSLSDIFFDPGDLPEIESIYADQLDPAAIYDYTVAVKHKEVLSPNLSMVTGLPSVDGFDGGILPLRTYSEVMSLILPEDSATTDGRLREYLPAVPDVRWLSLFNSRYLITDKTGDAWRDGVYFDRQHPVQVTGEPIPVAGDPSYEATEVWLLAAGEPPEVRVTTTDGRSWMTKPVLQTAPDLYRVTFPEPGVVGEIVLLPCADAASTCGLDALTLVDNRDGTFSPLTMPPYRLLFSGDVKIYENASVLPRAFLVGEWQWVADSTAAVAAMGDEAFDPARTAVIVGNGEHVAPGTTGEESVTIVDYAPESVRLRAVSEQDALLVLTDAYYPGWSVTVDGAAAEVLPVDGMFRGVFLPAGAHDVVFHYRPESFRAGAVMSLSGVALMALAVAWLARNRRGRETRKSTGREPV